MARNLIDRQILYDGAKVRLEVHHFDDDDGRRFKVEVCQHPGAVVVLPLLDDNTVVLIRNYRYAVGRYLIELPAGTLAAKEPPINAAGRELLEETGYLAHRLRPIMSFYASPGILSEKLHAFVATELQPSKATPELGEDIEVMTATLEEAIEMIHRGEIQDAKTIVTLMAYHRWGALPPTSIEGGVK
jgi:ADP-ribose pyrophosphatase